jgi:hypothetical protein
VATQGESDLATDTPAASRRSATCSAPSRRGTSILGHSPWTREPPPRRSRCGTTAPRGRRPPQGPTGDSGGVPPPGRRRPSEPVVRTPQQPPVRPRECAESVRGVRESSGFSPGRCQPPPPGTPRAACTPAAFACP